MEKTSIIIKLIGNTGCQIHNYLNFTSATHPSLLYFKFQVTSIKRDSVTPAETQLLYYLIEDNSGNLTDASRTEYLLHLFSEQETAIALGYPVLLQGESKSPPLSLTATTQTIQFGCSERIYETTGVYFACFTCLHCRIRTFAPSSGQEAVDYWCSDRGFSPGHCGRVVRSLHLLQVHKALPFTQKDSKGKKGGRGNEGELSEG